MDVKIAKENLLDIKRIFDEHELDFWLWCGTFLGAYRDGAFISYDDDMEIAILWEDYSKLKTCLDALKGIGFQLISEHLPESVSYKRNDVSIDIMPFKNERGKRVRQGFKVTLEAFEEFNEIPFLDTKFRIVSDPEHWLLYLYDEDWRTPIPGKHAVAALGGYRLGE